METRLNQQVLVLNRLWQAVNACSVRRAFHLLFQEHAHAIDTSNDSFIPVDIKGWLSLSDGYSGEDVIHTVSRSVKIPKIILLKMFDRLPHKDIKLTRENIFDRDRYTCQYCGIQPERKQLNIDHIIPRQRGGQTTWENVVCSCISCNSRKSNRTPHEAGMRLYKKPDRPKWRPFVHNYRSGAPEKSWSHFVDLNSWKVELST